MEEHRSRVERVLGRVVDVRALLAYDRGNEAVQNWVPAPSVERRIVSACDGSGPRLVKERRANRADYRDQGVLQAASSTWIRVQATSMRRSRP